MLGVAGWCYLRKRQLPHARIMLTHGLLIAFFASILQLGLGHYHAIQVAYTQPIKLAAFEGLFSTTTSAPLLLFGVIDGKMKGCIFR